VSRGLPSPRAIRFIGRSIYWPEPFDYDCRLVRWRQDEVELASLTDPPRRIILSPRYIGKALGPLETETTSPICTYIVDDGPPPPEGAHRTLPEYKGMASWEEAADGNVTVSTFDYPG
jgi:hypothetical protein